MSPKSKSAILLVLFCCLITYGAAFARPASSGLPQSAAATDSIELFDLSGNKINNGILHVIGTDPYADALTGYIHVKNNTVSPLRLFVKRTVDQQVDETANWFCFGITCYGPATDSSLSATLIGPGEVNTTFYGDYAPSGRGGMTLVTYEFYDSQSYPLRLSAKATVAYSVSATGITQRESVLRLSPNPVTGSAVLHYSIPAAGSKMQFLVFSAGGRVVRAYTISGAYGELAIDMSGLPAGQYLGRLAAGSRYLGSVKINVLQQ